MQPAGATETLSTYLAYLAAGIAFALGGLSVWALLSKRHTGEGAHLPYESGERSAGPGFAAVQPRYVVMALVFLLFEIEIAFMFPWSQAAFSYGKGAFADKALIAGLAFVLLLALGLYYMWRAGYLAWPSAKSTAKGWDSPIPEGAYAGKLRSRK